jgi:hypothetical protein
LRVKEWLGSYEVKTSIGTSSGKKERETRVTSIAGTSQRKDKIVVATNGFEKRIKARREEIGKACR